MRLLGSLFCVVGMVYYMYEIYNNIDNWYSRSAIDDMTQCSEVFVLQAWLITQSFIWCFSIIITLSFLVDPDFYQTMLCFVYLLGPTHLIWTIVAVISFVSFTICCKEAQDGCRNFYPYKDAVSMGILLGFSLVFALLVTVFLLTVMFQTVWRRYNNYLCGYLAFIT